MFAETSFTKPYGKTSPVTPSSIYFLENLGYIVPPLPPHHHHHHHHHHHPRCIPLRGNSVCILPIYSEQIGIFLIKFCSSDPSFNINIFRSLYLKFKTSAHAQIAITHYYVLTNFLT